MNHQLEQEPTADDGDGRPQGSRSTLLYSIYMGYLTLMGVLVPLMTPSSFTTYPIPMAIFVVSLLISFGGMILMLTRPIWTESTECTSEFFRGTLVFTGILAPCALLSILLPLWLSLLGLALIFIITIVAVAPGLPWFICFWIYQKVAIQVVRVIEKVRVWRRTTRGQTTTEQELISAD